MWHAILQREETWSWERIKKWKEIRNSKTEKEKLQISYKMICLGNFLKAITFISSKYSLEAYLYVYPNEIK